MNDLLLDLTAHGADLSLAGGDLALNVGLEEMILVSLFSDARANGDDLEAEGITDPRGWWAEDSGDRHGSLLWLLERAKLTQHTLKRLQDYCAGALGWMRQRELVERVDVAVFAPARVGDPVTIQVVLTRGQARQWSHLWEALASGSSSVSTVGDARVRILYR